MHQTSRSVSAVLRRIGVILAVVVGVSLIAAGGASAQLACPDTVYRGEYPGAEELGWTDNVQGVAHDDANWFFSTQDPEYLMKFPVGFDLLTYLSPEDGILERRMPQSLEDAGYDDFKDLDQANGFLFVPVAGDGIAAIAVFRASDLSYVGAYGLGPITHASFAAFNPHDGLLYVSGTKIGDGNPLTTFRVNFSVLAAGNASWAFTPTGPRELQVDGDPLQDIQGATFTPWGDLYVVNGMDDPPAVDRGGVHLFNPEGQLIDSSTNGYGTFNFAYDPSEWPEGEEPEGIDWWNREVGPASPGIGGQLHVIMLDNDSSMDDLYFKHYDVDYSCIAAGDEDADGLTNGDEIYLTGTDPKDADSDNDHLPDGLELNQLDTDPLDRDTDGDGVWDGDEDFDADGLSNRDEVDVHHTDPTEADTDHDLLDDGIEVAHGTDPLVADSDGDGLPDGQDVEFVRSAVEGLPASAFLPPGAGTQSAILALLDAVQDKLRDGKIESATDRLTKLRTHLDGCGQGPDTDDWIRDCASQIDVRELVDLLVANVNA